MVWVLKGYDGRLGAIGVKMSSVTSNLTGERGAANGSPVDPACSAGADSNTEPTPGPEPSSGPETPSGKGASDENFPVGSFLLPKALRPHVAIFYSFARAIDDVADSNILSSGDKISRLEAFDAALKGEADLGDGYGKAYALRQSLLDTNVTTKHGSDLIAAFVLDAKKNRYTSWDELIGYCELSANPVGRYLLDLHGEDPAGYPYSDALCTVLQIVNHLQDCGDDLREIDRVYIPSDWMSDAGGDGVVDLTLPALTAPMRIVVDRMLDGCEALMVDARQLPAMLSSKSLAMESAVIINLADTLIKLLRKRDPLAERVALHKGNFLSAGLRGVLRGWFAAGSGAANIKNPRHHNSNKSR